MPPKAARRGRRVADSDDEDEEMAPAAPAPSAPRADDDEDMDEAEEDVPADGDRMDRYQQNQLREERKFAAAIQSEKVVESAPSGARPLPSGNSNDRWERESDTSMESDDEVLEELDVFINQSLASRLYVLQYPLRQGADPFPDENRPESGRIKPMSRMVELNVPLDTTSENYDRWKGQELADGANDPNIVTKYGQRLIDTQVHSSTPVPISATYFVGVVKGAALHLTPVNKIVQMRPNLAYLNKPKEKPAGSKGDGDDSPTSSRIMQMSMRKTEGAESREENARKMAENAERKRAEEEPWTSLSILPPTSAEAETEREGLIGNELDYDEAQMQGNSATYLDEVAPRTTTSSGRYYQDSKDDFKVLKGLSLAEIQGYPLPEQLKCLMINANIIRFSQLRGLVNRYYSDERILEELPKVATLVRGCWVIRSSIIYRDRPAAARQMLLKLFNEQDYVTRQELIERARIPLQMATAMLQEIAVYVPNKGGWALRMGHDEEFLLQHEVLAAKLKASFERDVQNIEKELAPKPMQRRPSASGSRPAPASSAAALKKQASAEALKSGASTLTGPPVPPPLKSAASAAPAPKATATASSSASTPAPAATSAPAPKEKEKEKETEKEKDKGKAPAPVPVPDDVKVYEQNPVTTDAYPVEGASMHEQMRALVRQIFVKHGVVKEHVIKSYLWARANDASVEQNEIKPSNVTDAQVKSVLAELAVELGNAYVLRRLNDKSLDDYRDVVIELFKRKDTLKKADVTNEVLSKKLTTIPQPVYNRVMKEFATTANAVWTLKSGDIDE